MTIRDDFAGPGGWDEGLRALKSDLRMVGIEFDSAACLTAVRAGHERVLGSVLDIEPGTFGPLSGYIASPPCQTFSQGGKKAGKASIAGLVEAALMVSEGTDPADAVRLVGEDGMDERTILVLEPLRVIRNERPRWVALEQVPTALPIWKVYVDLLATLGYTARAEVLNAEQYGTPQARKRAILVAVRDDVMAEHGLTEVPWPTPTHSKYHRQTPSRLDEGVQPWVTMADALDWDNGTLYRRAAAAPNPNIGLADWVYDRPAATVVGSFRPDVMARPTYRQPGDGPRQNTLGSVVITVAEAGVLQGFPADYPWQGSTAKQFQQAGNAVPVPLAAAVLRGLVDL